MAGKANHQTTGRTRGGSQDQRRWGSPNAIKIKRIDYQVVEKS